MRPKCAEATFEKISNNSCFWYPFMADNYITASMKCQTIKQCFVLRLGSVRLVRDSGEFHFVGNQRSPQELLESATDFRQTKDYDSREIPYITFGSYS